MKHQTLRSTPLFVTTSWDDGDMCDLRVSRLLKIYNLTGTFYITQRYKEEKLSGVEVKELSVHHEVGAHTLTHPDLRNIPDEQKKAEINDSKKWLEGVIGKEVVMFCYPKGLFNSEVEALVRASGYRGSRTVKMGEIKLSQNPFQMPTTLAVYPMPFRKINSHTYLWPHVLQPFFERRPALRNLHMPLSSFRSFEALACAAFDAAHERGEVFHLWGHSWEIEKYGMWEELERVLVYIGNRSDCRYVTNGELL